MAEVAAEQARAEAIRAAARQAFERRTLHLFISGLAGVPLALLAMRSVTRHSHISFCASRQLAPVVGAAFLLLSIYHVGALVVTLRKAGRGPLGDVRDELILLAIVLATGAATYAWLGKNVLKTSCLA